MKNIIKHTTASILVSTTLLLGGCIEQTDADTITAQKNAQLMAQPVEVTIN